MQSLSRTLSEAHALGDEKSDEVQVNTDAAVRLTDQGLSALQEGGEAGGVQPLLHLPAFSEIWAVDFEYVAKSGENPEPGCLVAWELHSGRKLRVWRDQFGAEPPYPTGRDALIVAYYASAEIGCHLALGGPVPLRVL